jgi:hypothetical protein
MSSGGEIHRQLVDEHGREIALTQRVIDGLEVETTSVRIYDQFGEPIDVEHPTRGLSQLADDDPSVQFLDKANEALTLLQEDQR